MTMPPGVPDPSQSGQSVPTAPQPIVVNVPQPPAPPAPPAPQPQTGVTEDTLRLIEAARKEEKDKLYPTLSTLQEQVKQLSEERDARLAAEQAAQQAAAEAERQRQEAEMSALERFEAAQRDRDKEIASMQESINQERALRTKEAELIELERFKARRLAEEGESIAPQLVEFVNGSTQEQIEAAIARVKATSASLAEEARQLFARQGPNGMVPAQPGQPVAGYVVPGLPVSGAPPVDMAGQVTDGQRALSAQEIRDMPMEEYRQYREQILQAGSNRVAQLGPYAP